MIDCPECGKENHCYVAAESGLWKCQRCGVDGNFSKLQTYLYPPDPHAEILSYFHEQSVRLLTREDEPAYGYLRERGITEESIVRFRYGYSNKRLYAKVEKEFGKEALIEARLWVYNEEKGYDFPYFSNHIIIPWMRGERYVTLQGRALSETAKKRYIFLTGRDLGLYHPEDLAKLGRVWLTEGAFKRDALVAEGQNATALPGANAFKKFLPELRFCKDLWIVLDSDANGVGQAAALDIAKSLKSCTVVTLPLAPGQEKIGVDDFIEEHGFSALQNLPFTRYRDGIEEKPTTLSILVSEWKERVESTEQRGFLTGHNRLDGWLDGFHNGGLTFIAGAPHHGKCLGRGTPIIMYDGSVKNVEDIKNGDVLMGPDSKPRNVRGVTSGRSMLHRVTQERGAEPYVVNDGHILSVKFAKRKSKKDGTFYLTDPINLTTDEIYALCPTKKRKLRGYMVGVEFSPQPVNIDPYLLGVWLGDGNSRGPAVTTPDTEIVECLEKYCEENALTLYKKPNWRPSKAHTYSLTKGKGVHGRYNPLKEQLKGYGLLHNKHIPREYLVNSREVRLQLLAGLLDTDGYLTTQKIAYEITQKSEAMANGIAFLARSLGFPTKVSKERRQCVNNGKWGEYYRLLITGEVKQIPLRVERKKTSKSPGKSKGLDRCARGISLEPIGEGEYFGFTLDGDGLFLLGDFTVTHNTALLEDFSLRLYKNNPDITIDYYSNDDSLFTTITRWISKIGKLQQRDVRYAGVAFKDRPDDMARFEAAVRNLSMKSDRIKILDRSYNISLEKLRRELVEWREENPKADKILFIDAFTKTYTEREGELKDEMSRAIYKSSVLKDIAQEAFIPVVCTHEVPKLGGRRPNSWNLRGSNTLEYDADVIMLCHQEAHVKGINRTELKIVRGDEVNALVEVIIAKDKICGTPKVTDFFEVIKSESRFLEVADDEYNYFLQKMRDSEKSEYQS